MALLTSDKVKLKSGRVWEVLGGGAGPALLWLHGLSAINPADPILAALQRGYRVVAPIAPGFNDLAEIDEITNIHELILDYDDLLEELRLERLRVVGHSFGAMIGAELAAHFPRRVEKLVLLAPLGMWNDAYPVADFFAHPYTEVERMLWHDEAARDALASRLAEAGPQSDGDRLIATAQALTAVSKFIWPIPDKGLRRRLSRISAATLVIFGGDDEVVSPRYAADFGAGLRHLQSAVVAGAGHMLPYEKPDEVINLIERFLA